MAKIRLPEGIEFFHCVGNKQGVLSVTAEGKGERAVMAKKLGCEYTVSGWRVKRPTSVMWQSIEETALRIRNAIEAEFGVSDDED